MSPSSAATSARVRRHAFTLVEMLVVIGIMVLMAALLIPALAPLLQTNNLTRASGMIADEFSYAHQAALTRNADVEVRFYQTGSSANSGDTQFRAFRSVLSATNLPLEKINYLPGQVIISQNPGFSPLLANTNSGCSGLLTNQEVLPGGSGQTTYVSFMFRSTGGTSLTPVTPPTGLWYLTLETENVPINAATGLPNNYVTVQVDPVSGSERVYRP